MKACQVCFFLPLKQVAIKYHRLKGANNTITPQVALIPYSDERLQPRHTTLKVTIALVITAIIIGCLFFVFFPRHAGAISAGSWLL